jgi:DNA-binding NtrC family response regulator
MARGTILIADDDAAIRTVLNQALARAGYAPRATGNAATLWRWVSQGEGDVIITDVVMPDENAFELIPRIKRLRPDLPIIVMSAQNTLMTALTAAEKGAYEYLPKPFDQRARRWSAARSPSPAVRRCGRCRRSRARSCRSSAARQRCRRSTACWRGSRRQI